MANPAVEACCRKRRRVDMNAPPFYWTGWEGASLYDSKAEVRKVKLTGLLFGQISFLYFTVPSNEC